MRASTLLGLLVGGATLAAAGVAIGAARRPEDVESRPPYIEYRTKDGDTLSGLALRFFGDGSKWPVLLEKSPKSLSMIQTLPVDAVLRIPCQWYVVKSGDTLSKIAGEVLGSGGRWGRIYEANRSTLRDPNKLEVGRALAIPIADLGTLAPQKSPGPEPLTGAQSVDVGSGLDLLGVDL